MCAADSFAHISKNQCNLSPAKTQKSCQALDYPMANQASARLTVIVKVNVRLAAQLRTALSLSLSLAPQMRRRCRLLPAAAQPAAGRLLPEPLAAQTVSARSLLQRIGYGAADYYYCRCCCCWRRSRSSPQNGAVSMRALVVRACVRVAPRSLERAIFERCCQRAERAR